MNYYVYHNDVSEGMYVDMSRASLESVYIYSPTSVDYRHERRERSESGKVFYHRAFYIGRHHLVVLCVCYLLSNTSVIEDNATTDNIAVMDPEEIDADSCEQITKVCFT